jgi:hypothetical protein
MPALLRLPKSIHPNTWHPLSGFKSLVDLQQEKWGRYKKNHPPHYFDPAWHIEPTMVEFIEDGVNLWKWSIAQEKWLLDAVIIWRD